MALRWNRRPMRPHLLQVIAVASFVLLLRAWAGATLPVLPDEAYYWTWAARLEWSYLDHPPGIAAVLSAGRGLAGVGQAGLRLPPFLLSAVTVFLLAWGAARLSRFGPVPKISGEAPFDARAPAREGPARSGQKGGGEPFAPVRTSSDPSPRAGKDRAVSSDDSGMGAAVQAGLLMLGAPMFALGGLVATPDVLLAAVLALGAAAAIVILAPTPARMGGTSAARISSRDRGAGPVQGERRWAAIACGSAFALAGLAKQAGGLVALGALGGALLSARGRRLLKSLPILASSGLGAALLLLWISFDVSEGGAFAFQLARIQSGSPRPMLALALVALALVVSGGPLGPWVVVEPLRRALQSERVEVERVLGAGAGLLLLACACAAAMGSGEWHWVYPAFVILVPAGAVRLARLRGALGRWLRRVNLASAVVGCFLTLHAAAPFHSDLPWPRWDPILRGQGFPAVARHLEAEATRSGARVLVARRYQLASLLRFHLKDRHPVLEVGMDRPSQFDRTPRPRLCVGEPVVGLVRAGETIPGLEVDRGGAREVSRTHQGRVLEHLVMLTGSAGPALAERGSGCRPTGDSIRGAQGASQRSGGVRPPTPADGARAESRHAEPPRAR